MTMGGIQNYLARFNVDDQVLTNSLFSLQLDPARQILQGGGVIKIIPDGHHGYSQGLEIDFQGRRPFWRSFAELALATGATVLAVRREVDCHGKVGINVSGPLDAGTEGHADSVRVERLVQEYVALLSRMCSETPWLVPWYQMERHLAYSPSTKA